MEILLHQEDILKFLVLMTEFRIFVSYDLFCFCRIIPRSDGAEQRSPQVSSQPIPVLPPSNRPPPLSSGRSVQEIQNMIKNAEDEIQGAVSMLKDDSEEEKLYEPKEKISYSVVLTTKRGDDDDDLPIEEYQVKNVFKKTTVPPVVIKASTPATSQPTTTSPRNEGPPVKRVAPAKVTTQPQMNAKGDTLARAQFDYVTDEDDEISFKEGDIVKILKIEGHGWWTGEFNGKVGIFPGNFVELMQDNQVPPSAFTLRQMQQEKRCKVKYGCKV